LKLAERAAAWGLNPEAKQLPTLDRMVSNPSLDGTGQVEGE